MVYLILSAVIENFGTPEENFRKILKIGYSKDGVKIDRLKTYIHYNPGVQVLHTIPKCLERHEKKLHVKFKEYQYKRYGREWFEYNEEIVNYFKSATLEDLENLPSATRCMSRCLIKKQLREDTVTIFNSYFTKTLDLRKEVYEFNTELYHKILFDSDVKNIDDVFEYLKVPKEDRERISKIVNKDYTPFSMKVQNFMESFNKEPQFPEKMKLLCETVLDKLEIDTILDQIPIECKIFYLTVPLEKIKGYGYRRCNLESLSKKFVHSSIDNEIYEIFKLGSVYKFSETKEMLKELYKKYSIVKTPKAIDLLEYFSTKEVVITVDKKKS